MKSCRLSICVALMVLLCSCETSADTATVPSDSARALAAQDLTGTAWQMDYSMEVHEDTFFHHVPEHWLRIKTFTQNRFTFTGYDFEQNEIAGMGGGTYTLEDSVYVEHIEFHHRADFNGTQFQGRLYFDAEYLYQIGTVGEYTLEERWHKID